MADVLIYHPETQGSVAVPEESLHHYRQSGWMTAAEWNELQEQQAAAARQAARATRPAVPKTGKE